MRIPITVPMGLISTQLVEEWFDSDYIDRLAADMTENGQRDPVLLSFYGDHYFLEEGAHRFFAARRCRWSTIAAFMVKVNYCPKPGGRRLEYQGGSPEIKKPVSDVWALLLQGKTESDVWAANKEGSQ